MAPKRSQRETSDAPPYKLAPAVRIAVSLALVLHLTIVIAEPLTLPPSPESPVPSPLATTITDWAAPYLRGGSISSGYAFFAPDPGMSSKLVRYEVRFDDDREPVQGVLPDRENHWPRLLYHRHFMLAEQITSVPPPAGPPPLEAQQSQEAHQAWTTAAMVKQIRARGESFARHLLKKHDADEVELMLWLHDVPSPQAAMDGAQLDDPASYRPFEPLPRIVVRRESL